VGRVADGLPRGMAGRHLKGLGNAVVPQVAEHIGRLIMAAAA
jgi:DNA (cytosine-5)-methyltransferase 1